MRIHELAKELNVNSRELIEKLHAKGFEARTQMSTLDEEAVAFVRGVYAAAPKSAPAPAPAAAAPAPARPAASVVPRPKAPSAPSVAAPKPAPPAGKLPPPPVVSADSHLLRAPDGKTIHVTGLVVVRDLAECLGVKPHQIITEMMGMNILASINQRVDAAIARKLVEKHGFVFTTDKYRPPEQRPPPPKREPELVEGEDRPDNLITRPPVVVFMGHVDHGKTSLMDRIRSSTVAKNEFGGITQHIGAYTVTVGGHGITFLDTPGHAAFTAMRARGANLTDIAVVVVDAVDGVMPQTEEAIQHARAANVAIMVAINKIDLPAANIMRVKQQLQGMDLTPEDWGGQTICAPVSAITGEGVDHLLEMILLQAEMLDLKANPRRRADGFVIEAEMRSGMGPTANLMVKRGTLKVGDPIVCGAFHGNVRALINDHGVKVKSVGPSTPVRCLGLSGVPPAGAEFVVCQNEKAARTKAEEEAGKLKREQFAPARKASLDDLFAQLKEDQKLELRIILKADTQGSVEAILHALREIKSDKVSLNVLLSAASNITVNDVLLASASAAIILGFHVAKEEGVDVDARREGVEIRMHTIIYHMIDEVREAMTGLLAPIIKETITGRAQVMQFFPIGKTGKIAGCRMMTGFVTPRVKARVKRKDEVLYEGAITSLKRYKDSVAEVREGQECGIRLDRDMDYVEGDVLEFFELTEVQQAL